MGTGEEKPRPKFSRADTRDFRKLPRPRRQWQLATSGTARAPFAAQRCPGWARSTVNEAVEAMERFKACSSSTRFASDEI
ncbi:unnamed protein product [Urochloa humidicola]